MSEEIGKALQSVVERVNQAAARRPKVNTTWEFGGACCFSVPLFFLHCQPHKSHTAAARRVV